jgi:alpha-tubulin suppressor-like RCC1 family protein
MTRSTRGWLLLVVLPTLTACGSGETPTDTEDQDLPVASSVTVSPSSVTLSSLGASQPLTATVRDQNGSVMAVAAVTWSSNPVGVVDVSASGLATAFANGVTTVTAASGSASGTASVTVEQVATTVTVTPNPTVLSGSGAVATLSAAVTDANGAPMPNAPLTWSSQDEGVVTVDANGELLAVGEGTTSVTATSGSSSGSAAVTVNGAGTPALRLVTQPSDGTAGAVLLTVRVEVLDETGVRAASDNATLVTLALDGSGTPGATLSGTTSRSVSAGLATFDDLSIDLAGSGYTLAASASGFSDATSQPFSVAAPSSEVSWIDPAGGTWSDGVNWSSGSPPTATDVAVVTLGGTFTVVVDVDVEVAGLTLGATAGAQTVEAVGRTLTVDGPLVIGVTGTLALDNSSAAGTGSAVNAGAIELDDSSIEMALLNQGDLDVRGLSSVDDLSTSALSAIDVRIITVESSILDVLAPFTNTGTIQLATDIGPSGGVVGLRVVGSFINAPAGSVSAGEDAAAFLRADAIDNRGDFTTSALEFIMSDVDASYSNTGTVTVADGAFAVGLFGTNSFTNTGTIVLGGGSLSVSGQGSFVNSGLIRTVYPQALSLAGVSLTNQSGGTLAGDGVIALVAATATNLGIISPGQSPGTLTVFGDVSNGASASLRVELGGLSSGTQSDLLDVEGNAEIGGGLVVSLINGFTPGDGDRIPILTASSLSGTFATVTYPNVSPLTFDMVTSGGAAADTLLLVVEAPAPLQFTDVDAGFQQTCGVTLGADGYCWGINDGSLGAGYLPTMPVRAPLPIDGSYAFDTIAVGVYHACGSTPTADVLCWGAGSNGGLGSGTEDFTMSPAPIAGALDWQSVSAGFYHSCGIDSIGRAWCWGYNFAGQIGDSTLVNRLDPTLVRGGFTFLSITTGFGHACALTGAGEAYCWGDNLRGQLGDGSTTDRVVPVRAAPSLTFEELTAGHWHTCGRTADGELYCWGYNNSGQLGDGTNGSRSNPVLVQGGLVFAQASAGQYHTCGVTTGGAAYCWGWNEDGQLGNGNTSDASTPQAVTGSVAFGRVSAGGMHSCGVSTAGLAYCWGDNEWGAVGDGTLTDREEPRGVIGPGE